MGIFSQIGLPKDTAAMKRAQSLLPSKSTGPTFWTKIVDSAKNITPVTTTDYNALAKSIIGEYSGGSGSGGTKAIDLNPMINAYKQGASAERDIVSNEYSNNRQSLLDTIKRMREDTASARGEQRSAYNAARGDIENKSFMNLRGARQSSAAKGLGASGLQDINALQESIQAGNEISRLANKNITEQGILAKALTRAEEDTQAGLTKEEVAKNLKLRGIEANLANNIATLQFNENQRVASVNAAAAANASNSKKAYESELRQTADILKGVQSGGAAIVSNFWKTKLDGNTKAQKSALKSLYNEAVAALNANYAGTPQLKSEYKTELANLDKKYKTRLSRIS